MNTTRTPDKIPLQRLANENLAAEAIACDLLVFVQGGSQNPLSWQNRVCDLIRAQTKRIAELEQYPGYPMTARPRPPLNYNPADADMPGGA